MKKLLIIIGISILLMFSGCYAGIALPYDYYGYNYYGYNSYYPYCRVNAQQQTLYRPNVYNQRPVNVYYIYNESDTCNCKDESKSK